MGTVAGGVGRALAALARLSFERRGAALVVALLVTAASLLGARRLSLDTDLAKLLPRSFESVQALDELEKRSWGVGYVSVVATGADRATLRRFADDLAPELARLESIRFVDHQRPNTFFEDHGLYFMNRDDLETVRDRLETRHQWEIRQRSELYDLDLDDDEQAPPSLDFTDLRARYAQEVTGSGGPTSAYFEARDGSMIVLLAKPAKRASEVGFTSKVVADVQRLLDGFDTSAYGPDLTVELSGRYKKKVDQQRQIETDLQTSSTLALALMVAYLAVYFRRLRAVVLVIVPLLAAVGWTFGLTGVLFGRLNMLTGFVGAILLGLGIDHGIHLLSRYDEERARGRVPVEAVVLAFEDTGRAVLVAALTTAFGFVGVATSEFRAFRELGVIAACGSVLVLVGYALILPALLSVAGRALAPKQAPLSPFAAALPRWAPATLWLAVLGGIAAASFIGDNRFDYDFASLEDSRARSFQLDKTINQMLGRSQTPLVVVPESAEHERQVVEAMRSFQRELGPRSSVQTVLSMSDLVAADQEEKAPIIAEIREVLRGYKDNWLSEEQRAHKARLVTMASAEPFTRETLPEQVRRQFQGREGEVGLVLIFPSVSLSDGEGVRRLAAELRAVRLPDGSRLRIAGEAMVLADVLNMVTEEAPRVVAITLGLVLLVLLTLLRPSQVLPCAAVAVATLAVTMGLMPLTGVRFNYLNIVMLPVLFGIAVDGAVHISTRWGNGAEAVEVVSETGRAIGGAILTTMLGFGAMTLADHPGLRSLGELTLLGLAVNLLVCLVALPSYLVLKARMREAGGSRGARWARHLATLGWAGYAPLAPGTLGALLALPLGLLLVELPLAVRLAVIAGVTAVSVPAVRRHLASTGDADPSEVIVDELIGCLLAVALVPFGLAWALAAFLLFRVLDIAKPWPIGLLDRRVHGAVGVLADDIAAGLIAGLALLGLHSLGISNGWWT